MAMNANVRAQKILDKVQAATGLSAEGRRALVQLINPFADFSDTKVGCCDTNESASVIQAVKLSSTISAPAGAAGGNWDCNIYTTPVTNPILALQLANSIGGASVTLNSSAAAGKSIGGVTVATNAAGLNGLSIYGGTAIAGVTMDGVNLSPTLSQIALGNSTYVAGTSRVIGMGFEVHNTTSQLNVQGSVAVFRFPQTPTTDRHTETQLGAAGGSLIAPTGLINYGAISAFPIVDVPASIAQVMLLEGTQQWEAKDGCMVIPTLNVQAIDVQRLEPLVPQVRTGVWNNVTLPGAGLVSMEQTVMVPFAASGIPPITVATPASSLQIYPSSKLNPFNTSGAYFSGLSNSTTLTVNAIYYIERFPFYNDQDLVVLANPSPAYDPMVMQLYTAIMRQLPVGVKVSDNADGDWFYEAISGIADFLKPALRAVPGFGPALEMGANAVSGLAQKQIKGDKKPSPARKTPPATWVQPKQNRPQKGQSLGGWESASGMSRKKPKGQNKSPQKVGKSR